MSDINIVICGDKNVEIGVHCLLYSLLLKSSGNSHIIYFINDGYDFRSLEKIEKSLVQFQNKYRIIPINYENYNFDHLKDLHGNRFAYVKLLLAELIPADFVIYLDVDIIVDIDIMSLYQYKNDEHILMANPERKIKNSLEVSLFKKFDFDLNNPYFNSGVMLLNLRKWREQNLTELCLDFAKSYSNYLFTADQTVLNYIFYNNYFPLPDHFNFRVENRMTNNYLFDNNNIYHFYGRPKPWDLFGEMIHPQYKYFNKYLKNTSMSDYLSYKNISGKSVKKVFLTYKSYIRAILKL